MLISTYLDEDVRDGLVSRPVRLVRTEEATFAIVQDRRDGSWFAYPDQNYVLTYGEIAREIPTPSTRP